MSAYDQLDGDDRALLRGLLREWLRACGGTAPGGSGEDADIDALIALQAKGLISFQLAPEGEALAFSVVVPPEVQAALAAQSGRLQ